jgi:hypothetical protein
MQKQNRLSSLLGLLFSIFVCVESYRLDIGKFHNPGPGFFPFWLGMILGFFSLLLFFLSFAAAADGEGIFKKAKWGSIFLVLASLLIYSLVLIPIGFVGSTFLLVVALIWVIERRKWYILMIVAVAASLSSYLIFQVWLQSQLPKGILGF